MKITPRPAVMKTQGPAPYRDISAIHRLAFSLSRRKLSGWLGRRKSAFLHPSSESEDQVPPAVSGDGFPCPNRRTTPSEGVSAGEKRLTLLPVDYIQTKFSWNSAQMFLLHLFLLKGRLSGIRERAGFRQEPLAGKRI